MKLYLTAIPALGMAMALLAAPVAASPYRLTDGVAGLVSGDLTGWITDTAPAAGPNHVYVGPLNMTVTDLANSSSSQLIVYCSDIFDVFNAGGVYTLSASSLANRLGTIKADQISALLSHASAVDATSGAAIQAAIWEIENEPGVTGYDVTQPFLTVSTDSNGAAFTADTASYLANVSGTNGSNGAWQPVAGQTLMEFLPTSGSAPNQTFVFLDPSPVPEPATFALLGVGLLGLAACRRGRPG